MPSNSAYFKKIGDKKNPKKKKKRKKKSENDEEKVRQKSDKSDDPDARPRPKFPSGRIRTSSESRIDPIVHEAHAEESGEEGEETEDVKDEPSSIPSIPIILSEPVPSLPRPISNDLIVQPEQAKIKLSIITEHGKFFSSRSDTFIKDLKNDDWISFPCKSRILRKNATQFMIFPYRGGEDFKKSWRNSKLNLKNQIRTNQITVISTNQRSISIQNHK